MIRIFERDEIPEGFKEAIKSRHIELKDVKYVIHEDFSHSSLWDILNRFDYYETIPLITDEYIYVVFE